MPDPRTQPTDDGRKPWPHELYAQAQREVAEGLSQTVRERYRDLMLEHGHLIPKDSGHCCFGGCNSCPTCGGCRNAPLFGGCTCGSYGCCSSSFGLS